MAALRGHSGILKADGTPFCDGQTRNYRNSDPFFESWQGLYSESENPLAFIINPQSLESCILHVLTIRPKP